MPNTFTLTVPKADVSFFKTMAKKMGWTVERKKAAKPRLYDPETGDYLNDATMKVIENARKGKDVIEVGEGHRERPQGKGCHRGRFDGRLPEVGQQSLTGDG